MINNESELKTILENNTPELRTLDYKLELPKKNYEDRKEFLADIVSFANSYGGTIVYGVGDEQDRRRNNTGKPNFPIKGLGDLNEDVEIGTLQQIIQHGISAKIIGIDFKLMTLTFDKNDNPSNANPYSATLLVINIPQSWASPHMVTLNGATRFYGRDSKGKYPMLRAVDIRNAFLMSEGLSEKMESFREDRIKNIRLGNTTIGNRKLRPKIVLHLIPFSAFKLPKPLVNMSELQNKHNLLETFDQFTAYARYNIDGYVQYFPDKPKSSYTQFFRNGVIESVGEHPFNETEQENSVQVETIQKNIIQCVRNFLEVFQNISISPPFLLYVTFMEVHNYVLEVDKEILSDHPGEENIIDRREFVLPDIMIEEYQPNYIKIFKPLFDALWNSAGWTHCLKYPWEKN
jgi:hypothetical protein